MDLIVTYHINIGKIKYVENNHFEFIHMLRQLVNKWFKDTSYNLIYRTIRFVSIPTSIALMYNI